MAGCSASCAGSSSLLTPNDATGTRIFPNFIVNIIGWIFMFALSFLFAAWGPLTTCFIIPAEVFPTTHPLTLYHTLRPFNPPSNPLTHLLTLNLATSI